MVFMWGDDYLGLCVGAPRVFVEERLMGKVREAPWWQDNQRWRYGSGSRRETETERQEKTERLGEREKEIAKCYPTGFEDGGRAHKPYGTSSLLKTWGQGNRFSPRASAYNIAILTTWV